MLARSWCLQPILSPTEFTALQNLSDVGHAARKVSCLWRKAEGEAGLEQALRRICYEAEAAVNDRVRLVILSDREMDDANVAVPMLLTVGAVHHHLTRVGQTNESQSASVRPAKGVMCTRSRVCSATEPVRFIPTSVTPQPIR